MNTPQNHHSSPVGDPAEIAKFDAAAHRFWDVDGEFKPLHKLKPVRARYVQERCPLAGARALDVGCGGGLLAESLARAQRQQSFRSEQLALIVRHFSVCGGLCGFDLCRRGHKYSLTYLSRALSFGGGAR